MSTRRTFVLGAVIAGGLALAVSPAYLERDPGPDIATTCGTCQDPEPPDPISRALEPVQDLVFRDVSGAELPVVVEAFYIDGIRVDPLAMGPRQVVARHGTKPGRCSNCHPPVDPESPPRSEVLQ